MNNMNIKMKVNEEQSKQVQEICFELGLSWKNGEKVIRNTNVRFLYTLKDFLFCGFDEDTFIQDSRREFSAEDYIRTKGFTISGEEEQEENKHKYKDKTLKKPKKILKKFIKEITKRRQNKNFSDVVVYNECADILKDIVLEVCKGKKKNTLGRFSNFDDDFKED